MNVRPMHGLFGLPVAAALCALAACGGASSSTPLPTTTSKPSSSASSSPSATSLTLQQPVLDPADFSSGATAQSGSDVPDLTSIKCTPSQTSGLQQQYKSEIMAASGRVYGNVVAGFDNADDAHTFVTQFYSDAQSCSDASASPIQDNFGTYSFYFTITASPNDLRVEAVQVNQIITLIIQLLPSGTQPDQQSLRDLTQSSVNKVSNVTS